MLWDLILDIQARYPGSELDYVGLKSLLADNYAYPRDKITQLLEAEVLIRVKKGLYVFGRKYALQPHSKEILANLIYGPSAVSLHYALSYYQLIPEQVITVTSITTKPGKEFKTPIGYFTYSYLSSRKYDIGLIQTALEGGRFTLMATPEKALADILVLRKTKLILQNEKDLEEYLFANLRIDLSPLKTFNSNLMQEIAYCYQNRNVDLLYAYVKRLKT
jgi:hypothetical protein